MKMWTTLSVSRWTFLLSLAVVIHFTVSQVNSYIPDIGLPCCHKVSSRKMGRIVKCYEQKPRHDCNLHAFLIITKGGKQWCIDPASQWLTAKLEKKQLVCPPDYNI